MGTFFSGVPRTSVRVVMQQQHLGIAVIFDPWGIGLKIASVCVVPLERQL